MIGQDFNFEKIILPLAISFFTFQQIAFIVDAFKGKVGALKFRNYFLFMTFYPHLIAGPILHHSEIIPQFEKNPKVSAFDGLLPGLTRFIIGAFKKVIIADSVGTLVNVVFGAADAGTALSSLDAWAATLGYAVQLYFDFSGYADMALGSAMMLGIRLPENFNSPYKAASIVEFWRRWHMSLSRWLLDYVYIPLGGNRHGNVSRYRNVFITMLLGGVWHGAGYNFVIWGALHGSLIVINQFWSAATAQYAFNKTRIWTAFSWLLTFSFVVLGWVFFRAASVSGALAIIRSLFDFNGPAAAKILLQNVDMGILGVFGPHSFLYVIMAILLGAVTFPNSREIERYISKQSGLGSATVAGVALGLGILFALVISALEQGSQKFLYFDF